jgi:glycosyltransferase involved in cell wall biosynthesis
VRLPGLHFIVPGPLDQRTGGYIYDARMIEGLRRRNWKVHVHNLEGEFPAGDTRARESLTRSLNQLPDDAVVVIDGLAMGALPDLVRAHRGRLCVLALVHLLLADETQLKTDVRDRFRSLEVQALSASAGVLAASTFTAARVEALGIDAALVRAVPPGTDPATPAEGPGEQVPPRLLCVASITPRKGQDVLVRALARLADLSWTCVCAGSVTRSRTFADIVQRQTYEAGLATRIQFVGECSADIVDELYATSSLFVLPSYYEGYGMVLTEALARGLPVISTTGGAIPYTVPDDVGILVAPGDDVALADAIRDVLSDSHAGASCRTRRENLASASRRYASCLPDWDEATDIFSGAVLALVRQMK